MILGLTVSASIPAAIISMSILRNFFTDVSILENNIVQTAASAGGKCVPKVGNLNIYFVYLFFSVERRVFGGWNNIHNPGYDYS